MQTVVQFLSCFGSAELQKMAEGLKCLADNSELTQQDGKGKEDGKPCVTNVAIIFFEITLCQTSLSFKQMFL